MARDQVNERYCVGGGGPVTQAKIRFSCKLDGPTYPLPKLKLKTHTINKDITTTRLPTSKRPTRGAPGPGVQALRHAGIPSPGGMRLGGGGGAFAALLRSAPALK